MGAGLIASLLIKNPYLNIAGVILTSGMFGLSKERAVNPLKRWFVKLLGDHLEVKKKFLNLANLLYRKSISIR